MGESAEGGSSPATSGTTSAETLSPTSQRRDHQARSLAIIAACAALLGSVVGAGGGLLIANRQITAARSDASREERKTIYAEMSSELIKVQHAVRAMEKQLDEGNEVPADLAQQVCDQAEAAQQSYYVLILIGPDAVNSRAYFAVEDANSWCPLYASGQWVAPGGSKGLDASIREFVLAASQDLHKS